MNQIDSLELRQLVDTHGAALVLYARQWCRTPDDALQEALLDLIRQQPVPTNLVAWLYKTVRRRAMNLARAELRRKKHQQRAGELSESWFIAPDNPDEPLDLRAKLECLCRLDREIVVARIWGGLSLEQVAELLESSTSTIHRRYHRALAQLAQLLDLDRGNAEDDSISPATR